ncbi:3-hydroxyacyl-CoA dehydrogenase family protein [Pseudodesulfovibrio methanolicus]|uniref:3-hydroxyacyl-CoA dehydrogenase family protein n=1 Tax=Pseudodesulfovibrio methanolicus TaxID=3126690 RepID=A0ABZ2J3H4_9BACT
MSEISTVLVLGAGVMGRAIAQHLACAGIETTVFSRTRRTLDTCRGQIRDSLTTLAGQGLASEADNAAALSRITYVTDMAEPAGKVDLVIETVSENLPLKQKIFRELDGLCPAGTILATNTSSFDINEIASAAVNGPERVLGMHWFHPPNITPGIELIPGAATAPGVLEVLEAFCRAVGKVPTRCANAPGFVANRIQMAMVAEALKIVAEKLATPEEVDRIIRSTIGFRLGAFGPFEIADMAGTDTYLAIMHYMREKLGWDNGQAIALLTTYTDRGRFGLKAGAGFYDYDEASAARVLKLRDEFLSRRLALFNEENSERNP